MKRAWIVIPLAVGILWAPFDAEAQQAARVPRIGLLMGGTPASTAPLIEPFRQGLRELGYVEGQNIAFEFRYAEGKSEVLPGLAAELVRLKVNAIVVVAAPAIRAVKQATNTIPIVMGTIGQKGRDAGLGDPRIFTDSSI